MSSRVLRGDAGAAKLLAGLGLVLLLALVSGCGSDDKEGSTGSASATAPASGASDSASVAEAQAIVDEYAGSPTSIGYTAKLETSVEGKVVYFPQCGVPVCGEIAKGAEEAAAVLGVDFKIVDAGNTPESYKAAMQQILAAEPPADGVAFTGIEPQFVSSEISQLEERGVPIVSSSVATTTPAIKGRGIKIEDWRLSGKIAAAYVTSQSEGKAKTVFFDLANFPILNEGIGKGFIEEYEKLCAGCELERVAVQADTIGTALPGQVVSYIQKHPDTTWIFAGIGDMLLGVPQALKAAGLDHKVEAIAYSATEPNYQYVADDNVQTAIAAVSNRGAGWAIMHEAALAMAGQEVEQPEQPQQLLTKDTIDEFDWKLGWPGDPDFEEKFKALWADAK